MRARIPAPLALAAFAVSFPIRVWRRSRRERVSVAEALERMSADAWNDMPTEMRAEVDPERARREAEA